jgi:DNA-binding transcriptional LysR family regulator
MVDRFSVMETFIRVVETGSFSAAAKHLNVGQPAISKSVAQLEARLGVRLLIRSTRRLVPTEAGRNFCERARRAIEQADEADHSARDAGAGFAGRLRVSAPVTFTRLHVVPRLPLFLAAHPDLSVDLILDDREVDLVEEGIDIALRMGTLRDSSLAARKIGSGQRVVVGAHAYFDRAGIPGTPAELGAHEAVIYIQNGGIGDRWSFRRHGSEVSVRISGRLRVSAAEGLREAVLGGVGLAVASEWMFAPELASGAVRAVLSEWSLPALDLWSVAAAGRMASAKARAFAAFVEAELRRPIPDRNNTYETGRPVETPHHSLA